jgi:hypothetical protein
MYHEIIISKTKLENLLGGIKKFIISDVRTKLVFKNKISILTVFSEEFLFEVFQLRRNLPLILSKVLIRHYTNLWNTNQVWIANSSFLADRGLSKSGES